MCRYLLQEFHGCNHDDITRVEACTLVEGTPPPHPSESSCAIIHRFALYTGYLCSTCRKETSTTLEQVEHITAVDTDSIQDLPLRETSTNESSIGTPSSTSPSALQPTAPPFKSTYHNHDINSQMPAHTTENDGCFDLLSVENPDIMNSALLAGHSRANQTSTEFACRSAQTSGDIVSVGSQQLSHHQYTTSPDPSCHNRNAELGLAPDAMHTPPNGYMAVSKTKYSYIGFHFPLPADRMSLQANTLTSTHRSRPSIPKLGGSLTVHPSEYYPTPPPAIPAPVAEQTPPIDCPPIPSPEDAAFYHPPGTKGGPRNYKYNAAGRRPICAPPADMDRRLQALSSATAEGEMRFKRAVFPSMTRQVFGDCWSWRA